MLEFELGISCTLDFDPAYYYRPNELLTLWDDNMAGYTAGLKGLLRPNTLELGPVYGRVAEPVFTAESMRLNFYKIKEKT